MTDDFPPKDDYAFARRRGDREPPPGWVVAALVGAAWLVALVVAAWVAARLS